MSFWNTCSLESHSSHVYWSSMLSISITVTACCCGRSSRLFVTLAGSFSFTIIPYLVRLGFFSRLKYRIAFYLYWIIPISRPMSRPTGYFRAHGIPVRRYCHHSPAHRFYRQYVRIDRCWNCCNTCLLSE